VNDKMKRDENKAKHNRRDKKMFDETLQQLMLLW